MKIAIKVLTLLTLLILVGSCSSERKCRRAINKAEKLGCLKTDSVIKFSKKNFDINISLPIFVMQSSYNDIKTYTPTTLPFVHSGQTGLPLCVGVYFYMKPIKGYEDYLISECGTIVINSKTGKRRKIQNRTNQNYKFVILYKNKKRIAESIHRLVAFTYIDNPNNYPIINHIDSNPSNNHVSNLEWCTYSYNNKYSRLMGCRNSQKQKDIASITMKVYNQKGLLCKKVIDVKTGEIFKSVTLAAKSINMDKRDLSRRLRGHCKNKTNFQYHEIYINNSIG